ncbi:hypothetical protein HAP93_02140 [Acidithiobacillus ferriphilus]|uniref:hypothetical protein n=1 Tax=Acidithiobacillus ferriphilus TaxID=1689834 RepID=UPI001C063F52|nr:hypothetical protein [Acidithiobacillus ferriphilus]MBU2784574.1 hypothetical protein [Acidithiobacillus ferriphilus]MBU2816627.1 hypothetical protein [Acidithiobacillus ferrooxidans]
MAKKQMDVAALARRHGLCPLAVQNSTGSFLVIGLEDDMRRLSETVSMGEEALDMLEGLLAAIESGHVTQDVIDQAKVVLGQSGWNKEVAEDPA